MSMNYDQEKHQAVGAQIPDGYVRTVDGKVIPREKACFLYRDHKGDDGKDYKVASDRAYAVGRGGQLRRLGPPKLSKAEKKRQKKARRETVASPVAAEPVA